MIFEYLHLLLYFFTIIIVTLILIALTQTISNKKYLAEKLSAYECGFEPFNDSRHTFNLNFYNIALLFLLFDVEIILLLPGLLALPIAPATIFFWMFLFLIALIIGFIYEFKNSILTVDRFNKNNYLVTWWALLLYFLPHLILILLFFVLYYFGFIKKFKNYFKIKSKLFFISFSGFSIVILAILIDLYHSNISFGLPQGVVYWAVFSSDCSVSETVTSWLHHYKGSLGYYKSFFHFTQRERFENYILMVPSENLAQVLASPEFAEIVKKYSLWGFKIYGSVPEFYKAYASSFFYDPYPAHLIIYYNGPLETVEGLKAIGEYLELDTLDPSKYKYLNNPNVINHGFHAVDIGLNAIELPQSK